MSIINLSGTPRGEEEEETLEPLESAGRRFRRKWVFIIGSIVVLPLIVIAIGFNATRSSGEKSPAATEAEESEARADAITEVEIGELEPREPIPSPPNLLSDLSEAFEEGASSGLVRLSTEKEERLFEKMREASRSKRGLDLNLFRVDDEPSGIRVYVLRSGGANKAQGMIRVEQLEERWHVVGVAPAPTASPPRRKARR